MSEDIARAESMSLPIVFLLSLLIFGSLVVGPHADPGRRHRRDRAPSRWCGCITGVTDVSVFSINVITLLGMGLAIDYALFVVSRFREELAVAAGHLPAQRRRAASSRTMTTAGRTVLFSGLIVAASLASLLLFPQNFLRSMGYGGMAAVLVAMVAALTVLPALLAILGPRIEFGRMPWRRGSRARGRLPRGSPDRAARLRARGRPRCLGTAGAQRDAPAGRLPRRHRPRVACPWLARSPGRGGGASTSASCRPQIAQPGRRPTCRRTASGVRPRPRTSR